MTFGVDAGKWTTATDGAVGAGGEFGVARAVRENAAFAAGCTGEVVVGFAHFDWVGT